MQWTTWKQTKCCLTNFDTEIGVVISCFQVGYHEIALKIFFNFTLVPPVKIQIFMFLLPRLFVHV